MHSETSIKWLMSHLWDILQCSLFSALVDLGSDVAGLHAGANTVTFLARLQLSLLRWHCWRCVALVQGWYAKGGGVGSMARYSCFLAEMW